MCLTKQKLECRCILLLEPCNRWSPRLFALQLRSVTRLRREMQRHVGTSATRVLPSTCFPLSWSSGVAPARVEEEEEEEEERVRVSRGTPVVDARLFIRSRGLP